MGKKVDLLQGTLAILVLMAVSLGALHGYGILLRIQQISRDHLKFPQGYFYVAVYRMGHKGRIHENRACLRTTAAPSSTC
jgi:DNA-binding PadR family transcriptional regulator